MAPSYSSPNSVFILNGLKDFQTIVSQILIAINKDIPLYPRPYPFSSNSSNKNTTTPAKTNWATIKTQLVTPI